MFELDKRVRRAEEQCTFFKSVDKSKMTVTVSICIGDDEEMQVTFPMKFVVCDVCDGKGTHVNPSIDAHGITEDEFSSWDNEEREMYMSGAYDITCATCKGDRVLPTINEDAVTDKTMLENLKLYEKQKSVDAYYASIERQERMMGA